MLLFAHLLAIVLGAPVLPGNQPILYSMLSPPDFRFPQLYVRVKMHIQRNLVSHVAVSWHPHSKPRTLWLWNEDANLQLHTSILRHSLKLSTTDAKLMQNREIRKAYHLHVI